MEIKNVKDALVYAGCLSIIAFMLFIFILGLATFIHAL